MNKKDINELRKQLNKSNCSITKMCGAYVNSDKDIILNIDEMFLNLEDDEFDKYLAIAKKTLSGRLGNNLLELEFPLEEEFTDGKQKFLMDLKESKLKDQELLDRFYQLIIDSYDYTGNYLILLFHDTYDVIKKTSDNLNLDESEEVYEYIICAICPVDLSKPGLGYLEDENRIGPRHRDWVVSNPDIGFVFPAFTDRSSDIHSLMYYTRRPLEPHKELIELALGCPSKLTAAEEKKTFHSIIKAAAIDSDQEEKIYSDIQESISMLVEEHEALSESPEEEPAFLTNDSVRDILTKSSVPQEITDKIEAAYDENFSNQPPVANHLLDKKVLEQNEKRKVEIALMDKVEVLEEELEETKKAVKDNIDGEFDVVLRVKPEKVDQIKAQYIDGVKHILVPLDENEQVNVNGVTDIM